jgi:hypothetical protein
MSFAVGLSTPQPRSPSVMALHYTARGQSIIEALFLRCCVAQPVTFFQPHLAADSCRTER